MEPLVVIVASEIRDSLGVGYLTSELVRNGFRVRILDAFQFGVEAIVRDIVALDPAPIAVTFHVHRFQFNMDPLRKLITALRREGVTAHFTAGGHYPSLRPPEVLALMPEIDSIVLFEAEATFPELVRRLADGDDWRNVLGIAYRGDADQTVTTGLRPLERDLDVFPLPHRTLPLGQSVYGKKYAPLLASRGCVYRCSFCSVQEFYAHAGGPKKRIRRPEAVVSEMELLRERLGCSIFMFDDSDFPVTHAGGKWMRDFCDLLAEKKLRGEVLWTISCRVDELTPENVPLMKDHGLLLIFLGLESGTDEGLKRMEKHATVAQNLAATALLKKHEVAFEFGFMLLHPDATFDSIRGDLDFLDEVCGDGISPITFDTMRPFFGTMIERKLREQGRLEANHFDYRFNDPRLDELHSLVQSGFRGWLGPGNANSDLLVELCGEARNSLAVYRHYFGASEDLDRLAADVRAVIGASNRACTSLCRRMADHCEHDGRPEGAAELVRGAHALLERYRGKMGDLVAAIRSLPIPTSGKEAA